MGVTAQDRTPEVRRDMPSVNVPIFAEHRELGGRRGSLVVRLLTRQAGYVSISGRAKFGRYFKVVDLRG